jgi:hypothetical protein
MATIHGFLMLKPLVDPMFLMPRILEIGSKDQHSGLQGLGIQWGYAGDISATINGLKVWEHIYIFIIFSYFFYAGSCSDSHLPDSDLILMFEVTVCTQM